MNKYIKILFVIAALGFAAQSMTSTVDVRQNAYAEAFGGLEQAMGNGNSEG